MATIAVVRAKTSFVITAIIQDVLRSVMNCLAGESLPAHAVSRIYHIAVPEAELGLIGVSFSSINVSQDCFAVGNARAIKRALAARARN